MSARPSLVQRYLAPAPAERLAVLRILVVGFAVVALAVRIPELWRVSEFPASRFDPIGPWAPRSVPLDPLTFRLVVLATLAVGVVALVGVAYRVSGPLFAAGVLLVAAYRSSFGQVFHTEHLLVLHLLVVGFAPAADAWTLDPRRRRPAGEPDRWRSAYGWPVRLCAALTVLTYVLAGWAKVRYGGGAWLSGDVLRHQVAFDNVRKLLLGDVASPFAAWVVARPAVFTPLAWATLAVELGAPLALFGRRLRAAWVAAAWGFHVGILALMAITFPYHLVGIAYAPLFALERLPGAVGAAAQAPRRWWSRNASARSHARAPSSSS